MEEALTNPLIIESILGHLQLEDLKTTSLLNSLWYGEATKLLRKSTNIYLNCLQIYNYMESIDWDFKVNLPIVAKGGRQLFMDASDLHATRKVWKSALGIICSIKLISESIDGITIYVDEDPYEDWEYRFYFYKVLFELSRNVSSLSLVVSFHSTQFLRFLESHPGVKFFNLTNFVFAANWVTKQPSNRNFQRICTLIIKAAPNIKKLDISGLSTKSTFFFSALSRFRGRLQSLNELVLDLTDGLEQEAIGNILMELGLRMNLTKLDLGISTRTLTYVALFALKCEKSLKEFRLRFVYGKMMDFDLGSSCLMPEMSKLEIFEISLKKYGHFQEPPKFEFDIEDGAGAYPKLETFIISAHNEPLFKKFISQTFEKNNRTISFPQVKRLKYEYLNRSREPLDGSLFARVFPNAKVEGFGLLKKREASQSGYNCCIT